MGQSSRINYRSRQQSASWISYLKYIIIAALVVFVIFIFRYNAGTNKSFTEVEQALASQIDTEVLSRESNQTFKEDYGLNASEFPGVMLYDSPSKYDAQEILLVEVNNDTQRQEVEDAIERHIQNRLNDFENYIPEQALLLNEAVVSVRGNYVFLAISEDAEEYQRTFMRAL